MHKIKPGLKSIHVPARTQIYTEVLYNHMQYFDDRKAEGSSETDGWTER